MKINNINQSAVFIGIMSIVLLSATHVLAGNEQRFNNPEFKKNRQAKRAQMFEKLNLAEEQQQALKAHKESHRSEMKVLREQIKAKRKTFRQTLQNPDADENAIVSANNEMKVLMSHMADHRVKGILAVRKILTPEQLKKFNELKEQHRGERKGGHRRNRME